MPFPPSSPPLPSLPTPSLCQSVSVSVSVWWCIYCMHVMCTHVRVRLEEDAESSALFLCTLFRDRIINWELERQPASSGNSPLSAPHSSVIVAVCIALLGFLFLNITGWVLIMLMLPACVFSELTFWHWTTNWCSLPFPTFLGCL